MWPVLLFCLLVCYVDNVKNVTTMLFISRQTFEIENRVATAQGKQGIWFLLFPDRENTGNFAVTQGKFLRHRENILFWHREKFRHRENN